MGYEKVCDNVCVFFRVIKHLTEGTYDGFTLGLSPGNRSHPEEGIYSSCHFSEISAFIQMRGAPRKLFFPASIESQLSSA